MILFPWLYLEQYLQQYRLLQSQPYQPRVPDAVADYVSWARGKRMTYNQLKLQILLTEASCKSQSPSLVETH
ncbi:hypothetical protein EMCRGX_G013252 [Ephydatia muelleri]